MNRIKHEQSYYLSSRRSVESCNLARAVPRQQTRINVMVNWPILFYAGSARQRRFVKLSV